MKERRLAAVMAAKSRMSERPPAVSSLPNANQKSAHSAAGAKVSATAR
jgi:hypothetical protein